MQLRNYAEYLPVLVIVAFVVYPFAMVGLTAFIAGRSGRDRLPIPIAKLFALGGSTVAVYLLLTQGLGKYPAVTYLGAVVFVFGVAATGGLLGAIAELFVPLERSNPMHALRRGDTRN